MYFKYDPFIQTRVYKTRLKTNSCQISYFTTQESTFRYESRNGLPFLLMIKSFRAVMNTHVPMCHYTWSSAYITDLKLPHSPIIFLGMGPCCCCWTEHVLTTDASCQGCDERLPLLVVSQALQMKDLVRVYNFFQRRRKPSRRCSTKSSESKSNNLLIIYCVWSS